jgi:phage repressor protein C with HTH and peptisase S24 domain
MGSSSGARVVRGGEIVLQREDLAGLMRAVLEKGKAFRFEVRGASMRPVIRDGDVVTVSPLAGGAAKTGDVVAFVNPATGGVWIHRIVGREGPDYRLKGDNTHCEDGVVPQAAILGRVEGVEREGRAVPLGPFLRSSLFALMSRSSWFVPLVRRVRRTLGIRGRRT